MLTRKNELTLSPYDHVALVNALILMSPVAIEDFASTGRICVDGTCAKREWLNIRPT